MPKQIYYLDCDDSICHKGRGKTLQGSIEKIVPGKSFASYFPLRKEFSKTLIGFFGLGR